MKVVVLSDKKPGHFNQSLGIVQNLNECQAVWLEIQYRHKWRDNLLRVFMAIFGGISLPTSMIHSLLRSCLDVTSYAALTEVQEADVILSTGSSVAGINILLGKMINAKSVTCGRPSPIGIRYFDLAILSMLSGKRAEKKENVCNTIGVANPIAVDTLNDIKPTIKHTLELKDCPRVGVLLGGTDPYETISVDDASRLFEICDLVASQLNAEILLTTSRRTPYEVTAYLKAKFQAIEWCPLFVTPDSPSDLDDPYQSILSICDLLIVSSDSFSMVCEAASSGRKVIVLSLSQTKQRKPTRYRAYTYMADDGIIDLCILEELAQCIIASFTGPSDSKCLQDTQTAVNAIRQLF